MDMLQTRKLLFISIIFFWMLGCIGISTAPTALPTETVAPLSQPTVVPAPSAAPSPAAAPALTPEPGLRTNGPYFSYFRQVNGVYQLVLMDADGAGRKVIELPQELIDPNLGMKFVSPDGHWLAFYTGTAGDFTKMPAPGTSDLTLNLLDLETGRMQVVTPLLSKDYPNNFEEATKKLNNPDTTAGTLFGAFVGGIAQALAWSPDGKYLAFAGQMNGLSSDLYIYDMEAKTIQRFSSGDEELQWLDWSPDGKWIVQGSAFWAGEGMQYSEYAVTKDGSITHNLSTGYLDAWLNPHQYFEFDNANGWGNFNLRLVDVDTGKITTIWRGIFHEYEIDPSGNWLDLVAITSVIPPESEKPNFTPGLQLINLNTYKDIQNPEPLADPQNAFIRTEDGKTVPLVVPLKLSGEIISASPDLKYWIVAVDQDIRIYSSDIKLIKEISVSVQNSALTDLKWNPNSSNLFLMYSTSIYSVNIPTGEINLVETNLIDNYGLTYKWLTGQ